MTVRIEKVGLLEVVWVASAGMLSLGDRAMYAQHDLQVPSAYPECGARAPGHDTREGHEKCNNIALADTDHHGTWPMLPPGTLTC